MAAKFILLGLIVIQVIAALIFNISKDLSLLGFDMSNETKIDTFNDYYDKFYFRMAVYYIGMLGGVYFVEFKMFVQE